LRAAVVVAVTRRDGGCVAPLLDPKAGPCYDRWGQLMARTEIAKCEIDHWDWRGRGKRRAQATVEQVVMGCPGHHRGTGPNGGRAWMTANRDLIGKWVRGEISRGRHATP
jgi:hypothetical protein